jgi:hypothetical protein
MKKILTNKTSQDGRLDLQAVKLTMSEMFQLFTASSIFDFYIDAIYYNNDTINYKSIFRAFNLQNRLWLIIMCTLYSTHRCERYFPRLSLFHIEMYRIL